MYKKCCVPGCKDRSSKRHRFPKRNPARFDDWLQAVQPENYETLTKDEIYNKLVVCDAHFDDDEKIPCRSGLKCNAIPSINVPGLTIKKILKKTAIPTLNLILRDTNASMQAAEATLIPEEVTLIPEEATLIPEEADTQSSPIQDENNLIRIPKEYPRRRIWLEAIGVDADKWQWTKHKLICSQHFKREDVFFKNGKKFITKTAVPSLLCNNNQEQTTELGPSSSADLEHSNEAGAETSSSLAVISSSSSSIEKTNIVSIIQSSSSSNMSRDTSLLRIKRKRKFPKNEGILEKWLDALGIPKKTFIWKRTLKICSKHFLPSDIRVGDFRGTLKLSAVPHILLDQINCAQEADEAEDMTCLVPTCRIVKRLSADPFLSFHRIPRDGQSHKSWIEALGIDENNFKFTKSKFVCSKHFKSSDYVGPLNRPRYLKMGALPSLLLNGSDEAKPMTTSLPTFEQDEDNDDDVEPPIIESIPQFFETCRGCLKSCPDGKSLLGEDKETTELINKFLSVSQLSFVLGGEFPSHLCEDCVEKTVAAFEFQQVCKKSHDFVQTALGTNTASGFKDEPYIKTEPQEEEDIENSESYDIKEIKVEPFDTAYEIQSLNKVDNPEYAPSIRRSTTMDHSYFRTRPKLGRSKRKRPEVRKKPQKPLLPKCTKQFATENVNLVIQSIKNRLEGARTCCFCEVTSINARALCGHVGIAHKDKKATWCWICNEDHEDLEEHKKTHRKDTQCLFCKKSFSSISVLIRHLYHHKEYKRVKCPQCEATFKPINLDRHQKLRHSKVLPTTHPAYVGADQTDANLNQGNEIGPLDEDLQMLDDDNMSGGVHWILDHDDSMQKKPDLDDRAHICTVCNKTFEHADLLSVHMKMHIGKS